MEKSHKYNIKNFLKTQKKVHLKKDWMFMFV